MAVYFIRVGRYFKIGASDDPQRRLEKLHQSHTRYTFPADASLKVEDRELYKVVDGWKDDEARIHRALDDFAVGLEWFLDEPPLREFVDALPRRVPRRIAKVDRPGGFCEAEYREVQHGRAVREMARFERRRSA
jgi:hypothetical protein